MNDWLQKQLDAGFADFRGLSITARIPLRDGLVNELIAEGLRNAALRNAAGRDQTNAPGSGNAPDLGALLKFVDKAEIHTSDGMIVADVVINVS